MQVYCLYHAQLKNKQTICIEIIMCNFGESGEEPLSLKYVASSLSLKTLLKYFNIYKSVETFSSD